MGRLHLCFVFLATLTVAWTSEPTLEILPAQNVISKKVGEKVALTCTPRVDNPSLVTMIEWRDPKNRRIDSNRAQPMYVMKINEEQGLSLMFTSLTENHSGNYSCYANYAAQELHASVQMEIYVGIEFVDAPENQYPVLGKDFTVKCKVTGNPAPTVEWSKGDNTIVPNEKYVTLSDGSLIIKNVTELDDGTYKCSAVVVKSGETKSRNINVEVQIPPKILPMDSITIIEGETTSIKCTASGKPPPEYQWIKLRDRQDLAVADRFKVIKNSGELIITRIEYNDDGMYKCIAKNDVNRDEATVRINVIVKPRIYELLNVTAPIKTETKIICKVAGRPPPRVVFRKLSNPEPFKIGKQFDDDRITLEEQIFEDKGETFASLIISNLNRSDDGLYECIAENSAGTAYKNGHITVEFPPTFQRTKDLPPVWSWHERPGNLSCIPEAIPNATIIWRKGDVDVKNGPNFMIEGNGPISHLIVTPYNDNRFFTRYECIATNKLGKNSIEIELRRADVPKQVGQAKPESVTATTIKWSIVPPQHYDNLPIRSYTIRYKPNRLLLSWDRAFNHTWSFGAAYILENLTPEETYDFQIAATNDVGTGAFKNLETISMPKRSEPAEPRILVESRNSNEDNASDRENVVTVSPYADHFEFSWNVPNDNGDPIMYYLIRYCETERINGNWNDGVWSESVQHSVQHTSYQLDGLKPDTIYKIELRAHNAIGDSSPAQIRVRTARGIDPVVPVQSTAMSSSAIIGIVIAAVLVVLLVLDLTCYCINRIGLIALCCNSKSKQKDEEDPKLGREEQEPLKTEEKQMSLEFDGKQVYSKTGEIIGKHSAV